MERYFLGNNSAMGFWGNYEEELKDKQKVILLKGGPGTGKSTILKRLAKEAGERGYDFELWYCSGDPKSLDGVFVKNLNIAVVDATAPHATGADLPVVKDVIVDLATSLERGKLAPHSDDIKKLLYCKKQRFIRTYQHLKLAFCHLNNQLELEKPYVDKNKIRRVTVDFARQVQCDVNLFLKPRKLFVSAICPVGESAFYEYLEGKKVFKLEGSETARQIFFDELKKLRLGGTYLLNPLEPKHLDGIVLGNLAIVKDVGFEKGFEVLDLKEFEHFDNAKEIADEENGVKLEIAFAVEELNRAREFHLEVEKYFVAAMNFENNERLYKMIYDEIFDDKHTKDGF